MTKLLNRYAYDTIMKVTQLTCCQKKDLTGFNEMKHQSPASRHAWNPTEKEDWNVHGVELGYKNSWKMTPIQRMTSVVSLSLNIFHPIIINNNKKCKICCVQLEA